MKDQIITRSFDTVLQSIEILLKRFVLCVAGMAANHASLIYYLIQINTGKLEIS